MQGTATLLALMVVCAACVERAAGQEELAPQPGLAADHAPQSSSARPAVSDSTLDTALNDRRFIQRQIKCALGEAPCDPVGRRLKTLAPLVLRGSCPQCSAQEMQQIQRTLGHVQRNYPQEWSKIVRQYAG